MDTIKLSPCCKSRLWRPHIMPDFSLGMFRCMVCDNLFDGIHFIEVVKGYNPTTFYCDKCHKSLEQEINNIK